MFVIISLFWGHNKLCPAAFRWVADSASCTPGLLYHHSTSLIPWGFFFKRQSVLPMVFHHCQPLLLSYASSRHKWHPFLLTRFFLPLESNGSKILPAPPFTNGWIWRDHIFIALCWEDSTASRDQSFRIRLRWWLEGEPHCSTLPYCHMPYCHITTYPVVTLTYL